MKKILIGAILLISLIGHAAPRVHKKPDYRITLDSVAWLRERYCDMLAYDTKRAPATLTQLQRNFFKLPKTYRDSLLTDHYETMITLFVQERRSRAYAFADCYYALADRDDPNLGALYLNDMVLAIEECDTIKLRSRMDSLAAYADRNNLDYDRDLIDAEENMLNLRRRIRFDQTDMMSLVNNDGAFWILSPDDDGGNTDETVNAIMNGASMFLSFRPDGVYGYSGRKFKKIGRDYVATEFDHMGMQVYSNKYDNATKSIFKAWGNDRGGSTKPELLAQGRMTVQNAHAMVSGELARKKYSFGQRLGGELTVSLIDAGLNALFDLWSVTKQTSYRYEMSLTLISPDEIVGTVASVKVTTRSDRPNEPEVETGESQVRYIKTHPGKGTDGWFLLNDKCEPMISPKIPLSRYEKIVKRHKPLTKEWKAEVKEWKKQNKGQKFPYDNYSQERNRAVLKKLQESASKSWQTIEP